MESEYIALSTSMREFVFVKDLFEKIREIFGLPDEYRTAISQVFEDNQACLKLASAEIPKITPRLKHIAVKYHWFREKLEPLNVKILPIKSEEQLADIFTKGLARVGFVAKRLLVCGW